MQKRMRTFPFCYQLIPCWAEPGDRVGRLLLAGSTPSELPTRGSGTFIFQCCGGVRVLGGVQHDACPNLVDFCGGRCGPLHRVPPWSPSCGMAATKGTRSTHSWSAWGFRRAVEGPKKARCKLIHCREARFLARKSTTDSQGKCSTRTPSGCPRWSGWQFPSPNLARDGGGPLSRVLGLRLRQLPPTRWCSQKKGCSLKTSSSAQFLAARVHGVCSQARLHR